MPLSGTLNIDSFYNNGAADAGVTYEVPSDQQSIIEVNASGVVTPKKLGTAIVNIKASGVVIGNVTISVVSAEEWALVEDPQALITNAEEMNAQSLSNMFLPTTGWTKDFFYINQNFWQSGGNYLIRTHSNYLDSTGLSNMFDGDASTYVNLDEGTDTTYILIPVAKALKKVEIDFLDADPNNSSVLICGFAQQYGSTPIQLATTTAHKSVGTTVIEVNSNVAYPQFKVEFIGTNPNRRVSAIRLYE